MSIDIKVVESKKDLKTFVKFPHKLYKGNPYWVPQLIAEDMEIFDKNKNPAHQRAETKLFLAYKDGNLAGRVAAILSRIANEKYKTKNLRFGWFDTIEDYEVAEALLRSVETWGKELGMESMTGPHGFTDLDPEGMLIEGYDQLPTIAVYYNYPYYPEFMGKYGFEKEIDWIEFKGFPPYETGLPEKLLRIAEKLKKRSSLKVLKFKKKSEIKPLIGKLFHLIDEAFEEIYGSVPITEKQVEYYVKKYFPMVNKDLLKVTVNAEGEPVGFLLALPSLSKGFQKAKGRLLPFGLFHILRAATRKDNKIVDLYLAGIRPKYRGTGADLLMLLELAKSIMERKFDWVESNPELETNTKIHGQWKHFRTENHKRRRLFRKKIDIK